MDDVFLIYSTIGGGGWILHGGTSTTDWQRATGWLRDDAIRMCAKHRDHEGQFMWMPIERNALLEIHNFDTRAT